MTGPNPSPAKPVNVKQTKRMVYPENVPVPSLNEKNI